MTTLSQWDANLRASLGLIPKSYKQASKIVQKMKSVVDEKDGEHAGFKIRVLGHSKGGGEAIYAAAKQRDKSHQITATALCPSHLSQGLMSDLPDDNLAEAKSYITSYSPVGDPVSALRGKLPQIPGLGMGYHFDGIEGSSPTHLHDQFLAHVTYFCQQAPRSDALPDA